MNAKAEMVPHETLRNGTHPQTSAEAGDQTYTQLSLRASLARDALSPANWNSLGKMWRRQQRHRMWVDFSSTHRRHAQIASALIILFVTFVFPAIMVYGLGPVLLVLILVVVFLGGVRLMI